MHTIQARKRFAIITALTAGLGLLALTSVASKADSKPAVSEAQQHQVKVTGPFPSDTLYLKVRDGHYDCALSMYHDQGQIAIKLLGFDQGVSVLGGLPMPIATPAHGTAFDIVGTNRANVQPALNALRIVSAMASDQPHRFA